MSYSFEFARYGENGFVNITANELGLLPQGNGNDPTHRSYLDAVPFSVAAWHTEPWEGWSETDRKVWMPYLEEFLTRRLAEVPKGTRNRDAAQLEIEALYPPIKTRNTIRVFELMPSYTHEGLHGRLHQVDIAFAWPGLNVGNTTVESRTTNFAVSLPSCRLVCYTALSYFWGPPKFDKTITINGIGKRITSALHDALVHLRHEKHSVLLWVDQLCIDQTDPADKGAQITLMGKIYSRAWNTAI